MTAPRRPLSALLVGGLLALSARSARPEVDPATTSTSPVVSPLEAAELGAEARIDVFSRESYRFCHDPQYGARGTLGVDFCGILDETTADACPEAHARCAEWRWPKDLDALERRRRVLYADEEDDERIELPRLDAGFAQLLLLAGGVALVVLLLRSLGRLRRRRRTSSAAELPVTLDQVTELPDTAAQVIVREARSALERGDAPKSALLLHLALLRHLDDEGLIRFHPSFTNGEYARSLRAHPDLQATFRGASRQVERLRFGGGDVDELELGAALGATEALLARPGAAPPAALAGLLVAIAAGGLPSGCLPRPDAAAFYFDGPTGLSALPQLLEAAGVAAEVTEKPLDELHGEGVIVIRTASLDDETLDPTTGSLGFLLDTGADVIVLDDGWNVARSWPLVASTSTTTGARAELRDASPSDEDGCRTLLEPALRRLAGAPVVIPDARRLTPSAPSEDLAFFPLVQTEAGRSIAVYGHRLYEGEVYEGGGLYVFSDRDLFTNASLTRPDNAAFVAAFFASLLRPGERVMLVDGLEGYGTGGGPGAEGSPDAKEVLRASKLLPFLLQLFALLLALAAWRGATFGSPRDRRPARRRAFAEHTDAIGRLYDRAGTAGERHSARALARWVLHANRARLGHRSRDALARELAEERGLDPEAAVAALALAHGPEEGEPPSEVVAQTLMRLVAETGGRAVQRGPRT